MTQEEKAEAYSKAVEKAKQEYSITTSEDRKQWLEELFPELRESEDERIRKEIINYIDKATGCKRWVAWLEKQGEQEEPQVYETKDGEIITYSETDGYKVVEPKFKVGDWIVFNGLSLFIKEVIQGYYRTISVDGIPNSYGWDIDNVARLWNISDVKEGDVLVDSLGNVCIYQEPSTKLMYHSHCYGNHKYFIPMGGSHEIVGSYPATKEQRDQLEKAMADAGYVFDFEKKELKEIENEEYDGDDYGIDSLWHARHILKKTLGKVDGYQSDDEILEHKCAISAVDKLYKHSITWSEKDKHWIQKAIDFMNHPDLIKATPTLAKDTINWLKSFKDRVHPQSKQEWSDEDESNFQGIIDELKANKHHAPDSDLPTYDRFLSWFKSLKDRYVWKPSDEQIDALDWALSLAKNCGDECAFDLRTLQEQLKKI